jgi:hypothetical protein
MCRNGTDHVTAASEPDLQSVQLRARVLSSMTIDRKQLTQLADWAAGQWLWRYLGQPRKRSSA